MIAKYEMEWVWKETIVAYFKALSEHSPGEAE
jgi:hypothetical protein